VKEGDAKSQLGSKAFNISPLVDCRIESLGADCVSRDLGNKTGAHPAIASRDQIELTLTLLRTTEWRDW
jgi:hypothetical protein